MSAETATYSNLSTYAALTAITALRIYADTAPEGTPQPYVVFQRSSSDPTYTINGTLVATEVTMTVVCWAKTRVLAEQMGDLARTSMQAGGYYVTARSALYDEETESYAAVLDFRIWE